MKFINEAGIEFDDEKTSILNNHAKRRGLKDLSVFIAKFPDGKQTYILFENTQPIKESTRAEDIWAWIDMMYLDKIHK